MTNQETLYRYRLTEAEETLKEAERMLKAKFTPRSIVNRGYYSVFYSALALFIKTEVKIKSSKHSAVIAVFDKEFVHSGKFDKFYSKTFHKLFKYRVEGDYKAHIDLSVKDAGKCVELAKDFVQAVKKYIKDNYEKN